MGIKYFKQHLVLKYRNSLHRYIQTEMDFQDISSLGAAYRYAIKIEQKFKLKNKQEFGFLNRLQQKPSKSGPNSKNKGQSENCRTHDNQSKLWIPQKPLA